jgi:hypothetical protein
MKRLSLLAIAALIPGGLLVCAGWWIVDRVRTRNRVMYVARDFGTPRVTVTAFVPAKQWHGRA